MKEAVRKPETKGCERSRPAAALDQYKCILPESAASSDSKFCSADRILSDRLKLRKSTVDELWAWQNAEACFTPLNKYHRAINFRIKTRRFEKSCLNRHHVMLHEARLVPSSVMPKSPLRFALPFRPPENQFAWALRSLLPG